MSSPDDKTVIVQRASGPDGQQNPAEAAGADRTVVTRPAAQGSNAQHALAAGTRLGEFEIVDLIGEGGFGIVYLAYDTQLGRHVALKEYIPAALATRVGAAEVSVRSERHEDTFRAGLKSFINEARLLARFDHHSLVKVYRFWEANGTAYMVMPYYEGVTLRDGLRRMSAPPDEAWLRALLAPLLEALAVLHAAQCYHRDIAPDNIMLLKGSGRPVLLDFGAARRVIGDMTQALTVILKPGYAPVEQYAEEAALKQGPWTDVYALAAVVYFAIQGKTPPPSVGRLMSDTYVPLATAAAGRYSERFLRAIDHALAVRPEDRPQSVEALADELGIAIDTRDDANAAIEPTARASVESAGTGAPRTAPAATVEAKRDQPGTAAVPAPAGSQRKRTGLIAAGAVCVVALAAVGTWFAMRTPPAAGPAVAASTNAHDTASPKPAETPAPTPGNAVQSPAAVAAVGPVAPVAPASPATITGAAAPPAQADILAPFTPASELERIVTLADPSIQVTATPGRTSATIGKDYLQFKLDSNRAGYVYVFMVDPDGQYLMLFPNGLDRNNRIAAGQTLSLPRASWPMLAGNPPGPNHFLTLVSTTPRDFSDGGLKSAAPFQSFPADAQQQAAARRGPRYSPFAGKPRCPAGTADCAGAFGAATFTIDAVKPRG
ncbi:protein kinase domain-containing protein [Paraburkholderia youngii]|uniref:protein kinase domain-containing protein n=1 Tax=Paraburkholderia youngii TaxID=2782701 RepID=UPI003D1BAA6D